MIDFVNSFYWINVSKNIDKFKFVSAKCGSSSNSQPPVAQNGNSDGVTSSHNDQQGSYGSTKTAINPDALCDIIG